MYIILYTDVIYIMTLVVCLRVSFSPYYIALFDTPFVTTLAHLLNQKYHI